VPYKDKDKQRTYQREWLARRRAEFMLNKVCKCCESAENLELHYRDPEAN